MSSLTRRIQIRSWKRQNKERFSHDGAHGGFVAITIPGTLMQTSRTAFAYPLLSRHFTVAL